jgi:hypothetical protein
MNKIYIGLLILIFIIVYTYFIYNKLLNNNYSQSNNHRANKFISLLNTKYNNTFPKLIFISHFELGDSIVVNGIVRYYCSIYHTVFMPCKSSYYNQIKFMYSDLSNLVLYKISNKKIYQNVHLYIPYNKNDIELYNIYNIDLKVIGCMKFFYNKPDQIQSTEFPIWIYDDLKLNNIAYDYFKLNRNYTRENELYNNLINIIGKKYVVLIEDEKRNFVINPKYLSHIKYPIFKLSNDTNKDIPELNSIRDPIVFNFIKILENANEIISIDSSIPWIIDFLNINVNTSVHTYIRDGYIKFNNKNIKIITGSLIDRLFAYLNIHTYNGKYCQVLI